jgi:predicted AAA+ superfamily ATPase
MPEAIAVYASTHDLSEVSRVHSRLIRNYRDDFAKYAKQNDWEALNIVFDRLPAMIGRNRINYSKFDAHMRGEKIRRALTLLSTAGLVHRVISSQANQPPLNAESDPRFFKLLLLDIGLMQAMLGFDWRKVRPDMPVNEIHDGAFAEQFVGQELICSGSSDSFYQPHYWYRGVKGSEAEVDYVIVHKGCVTPVEVKSGSRGTLKSLALYQEKFTPAQCLVLSMQNSVELERIRWVPLFLASRLL